MRVMSAMFFARSLLCSVFNAYLLFKFPRGSAWLAVYLYW